MYGIFTVLGYIGALLTAIYTFRLIFRVLPGEPCKEAQELIDTGHVAHGRPPTRRPARRRTPRSASPAPSTTSPSSRGRCGSAMAVLAFLAPCSAAWSRSPGVDDVVTKFLDPVFARTRRWRRSSPRAAPTGRAWRSARRSRSLGIGIAYCSTSLRPGDPGDADPRACARLHTFFVNKWYFDEAIDMLVVRPALAVGRFANRTFERVVVDGLVSGTAGDRRAAPAASSAPSRAASSAATRCC